LGRSRIALLRWPHAAATGRAERYALPLFQQNILAVVDLRAVDAHLAAGAGLAAVHAGSREAAALGHEDDAYGRVGDDLELDLLAEAAAEAARAAAARAQLLAVHEQRAVALDQLDGDVGDVAGPGVGALAVVA